MAAILPLIVFASLVAVARLRLVRELRDAVLLACIGWGLIVVAITETLSAVRAIAFVPLLLAWLISAVPLALLAYRAARHTRIEQTGRLPIGDVALLAPVVLIVLLVAVAAFRSPPNTWDSLTYHMSRVAHWTENRSVSPYPHAHHPSALSEPIRRVQHSAVAGAARERPIRHVHRVVEHVRLDCWCFRHRARSGG